MDAPARFGRYEVLELLGQGAMGAVYKARDPVIDRTVAVKTVGAALMAVPRHREEYLARFRQEARAAGRLSHPGIVSVYDAGVEETTGTPFIVMEYVPGVSLAAVIDENPSMPVAQALEILDQVGSALIEAHRQGIVHRDIKPGNILLDTRGAVKVGDFGIARVEGSELTQTGVSLGTPGYLAPEVLRGAKADARADVFALGVVAYALLTGRRPFSGTTPQGVGLQVLQHDPEPPDVVRPDVPAHVSRAVMRALAKSPEDRTPGVDAFLADLHGGPSDSAAALPAPAARRPGRALLAAGLLAVLALLAAAAWLAVRALEPEAAAQGTPRATTPATRPASAARTTPTRATAPTPRMTPPAAAISPSAEDEGREAEGGKKARDGDRGKKRGKGKKKGHRQ